MTRVAWVESPLQLVNAVEYAAATGEPLRICLRANSKQLQYTADVLAPHLPEGVQIAGVWNFAFLSPFIVARERLAGDPYSGQFRLAVALTGVRDLVAVDDGSAMLGFVDQVRENRPLARHGRTESWLARRLGTIAGRRLHHTLTTGGLRAFTAYSRDEELHALAHAGGRVLHNKYRWVRRTKFVKDDGAMQSVILGSALHDDGYVKGSPYRSWVEAQVAAGATVYFPHRREKSKSLKRLKEIKGLKVRKAVLPIEIVLASSRELTAVVTLPSSVVATLRNILPDGVQLTVFPVPEDWLTKSADEALRTTLRRIAKPRGAVARV
ncbi:hypothetical protein [Demequina aurantiaca]|uniref:hypothetical protein n=1 Tax=Demequina aurantiaca TaxID=676200 RepID=UPI000784201F|nr:hypothetical protein [Demequina aurantiaca]